ncbi:MAG: phenylalanine--tRNA ligase subunit beta [Proteobacteria bacterium]|nr:MAG: phenylalanine--tRNA ligase subunit beta [Pseudomonadota bacterium]
MRVPLSWLADFVDAPDAGAIAAALTQGGLEVESATRVGPDLSGVRVGHVVEREKHPNADRLSVCRVDLGEAEPATIVCGAPNVAAGQKVAVVSPGATLPGGQKLEKAKIRGVVSHGMICSAKELGLAEESEGILVLDPAAPVGAPLDRVVAAGDTVLEVALTPNRGDCASILGIAREVRAHFGGALRLPPIEPAEQGEPAAATVRVAIDDRAGCPRYCARLVRGVTLGASPAWLVARLEAAGMRSINAVVDVTNLVLLELGQPLHAFDWRTIRGGEIHVRRARADEKIATLDGATRALASEDLVIADAERAIAIAGVMGGAETEVGERTRDVLLESAHFDATRVRRTARRLGLATEASYRFERGIDDAGVRRAIDRAARLVAEICGGSVAPGVVEALGDAASAEPELALEPERVNRLLGTALDRATIAELLARVDVAVADDGRGPLRCRVPSHRNDVRRAVDLVEEVARIHGYDHIPTEMPVQRLVPVETRRGRAVTAAARDALVAAGLVECMTLPFASGAELDAIGLAADDPRRRSVRLVNALTEEESRLRTTLAPSLLGVARANRARQHARVRAFEVGRVFAPLAANDLPRETLQVAGVLVRGEPGLWDAREPAPLFFEAKGVVEATLAALGVAAAFEADAREPYLHPGASARISASGRVVGAVGELHPETAARLEIDAPCALFELDLDALAALPAAPVAYREVSRHPSVRRDLAVLLPRAQAAGDVLAAIRGTAGPHLVEAAVFDRYEGRGVPEERVSVAFRLVFQRPDRTLTDAEVARATDRVVRMLADRFGGELRQGAAQAQPGGG